MKGWGKEVPLSRFYTELKGSKPTSSAASEVSLAVNMW